MRLTNLLDTYVSQIKTTTNYSPAPTLQVSNTSSKVEYGLLLFSGTPTGPTVTVSSAILRVYAKGTWASTAVTAEMVTGAWTPTAVTYTKRPAVTVTGAVTVTQTAVEGTEWAFDITAFATAWAGGAPNLGVRLRSGSTTMHEFYSSKATGSAATLKPVLDVTWSSAPSVPTGLNPTANQQVSIGTPTLTWIFSDPAGQAQSAYEMQTNATNVWTSPTYDATISSALSQHVLASAISAGSTLWWRVRAQNVSGRWSDWSAGQQFGRTNKGTLTITTPASGSPVVTELTPPFAWSFSGTETNWRIFNTDNTDRNTIAWDSLTQPGTDVAYTSPLPFRVDASGDSYTRVQVIDNVNRANTPGDPPYVEASRTFHYAPTAGTAAFTTLVATQTAPQPGVTFTFARSSVPDAFQVVRTDAQGNVKTWTDLNPLDYDTSSTTYAWSDLTAAPQKAYTYRFDAIVNGIASTVATSPTASVTIKTPFVWILDPLDPSFWLAIAGQDAGSWGMGEQSDVHEIRGADRVAVITQALRGYEGSFSGGLYTSLPGLGSVSAQTLRDRVWTIKGQPTKVWRLVISDMNIPVVLRNVSIQPTPHVELDFGVSFDYMQQGETPFRTAPY